MMQKSTHHQIVIATAEEQKKMKEKNSLKNKVQT